MFEKFTFTNPGNIFIKIYFYFIAVDENYQLCIEGFLTATNYSNKSKKLNIDLPNLNGLTAVHLAVMYVYNNYEISISIVCRFYCISLW
jgi:hypothetical protein